MRNLIIVLLPILILLTGCPAECGRNIMGNFILFLIGIVIYFIPSLIAKDKKDATAIFLVNLFTGWTFIGWVASFIWALVTPEIRRK